MKLRTIAAAAVMAWTMAATGAAGQECEADASDCFDLWNGCEPIDTFVFVSSDGEQINLQDADVENVVESRLRAARIYSERGRSSLDVAVRFAGSAFDVPCSSARA